MDNYTKLITGGSLHHITNASMCVMCVLMCIASCGKAQRVSFQSHNEKTEWGYETENGPDVWGQLSPEYILCAEGKHQSPIDLVNPTPADLPPITFNYRSASVNIRNTGHTIEVAYPKGNWIEIDRTKYNLLQFHFHAPSEHTVEAELYDMEMHLVHESEDGTLAVIGVLIKSGNVNTAFDSFWHLIPSLSEESEHVTGVILNAFDLLPDTKRTYRYNGSLTTPPCSEGVKWLVMTTPIEMSESQIAAFRAIIHDNNRPVQPLNGRKLLVNVGPNE